MPREPAPRHKVRGDPSKVALDEATFKKFLEKEPKQRKGSRKNAPDPRLDPNIDPRRAKRIVANRESAARSKAKQKQHLENLKSMHRSLYMQKTMIQQELDAIQADSKRVEEENATLVSMLHAYRDGKLLGRKRGRDPANL